MKRFKLPLLVAEWLDLLRSFPCGMQSKIAPDKKQQQQLEPQPC